MNIDYKETIFLYNPIKIFVVVHETFEETNVFFTNFDQALKRLKKFAKDTNTHVSEWRIRTLIEGKVFNGDLCENLHSEI